MLTFLESSWPLWWLFAIVLILRWFHFNGLGSEIDDADASRTGSSSHEITAQTV